MKKSNTPVTAKKKDLTSGVSCQLGRGLPGNYDEAVIKAKFPDKNLANLNMLKIHIL